MKLSEFYKTIEEIKCGTIISFAGNVIPQGFLLCNGAAIQRNIYTNLFQKIGTKYGSGDGTTTFNLPYLLDKFIEGSSVQNVGNVLSAGLPVFNGNITHNLTTASAGSHTHSYTRFTVPLTPGYGVEGGSYATTYSSAATDYAGSHTHTINGNINFNFNGDEIYGKSSTVQPPALKMIYCIKY